jgi:hypothetical protein
MGCGQWVPLTTIIGTDTTLGCSIESATCKSSTSIAEALLPLLGGELTLGDLLDVQRLLLTDSQSHRPQPKGVVNGGGAPPCP